MLTNAGLVNLKLDNTFISKAPYFKCKVCANLVMYIVVIIKKNSNSEQMFIHVQKTGISSAIVFFYFHVFVLLESSLLNADLLTHSQCFWVGTIWSLAYCMFTSPAMFKSMFSHCG